MKRIYLAILIIFGTTYNLSAQSLSTSKILDYLEKQDMSIISADLVKLGFTSTEKKETTVFKGYGYSKNDEFGSEKVNIAINDELFSVIYKPATKNIYSAIKEKMLTKDFPYSYSYQATKYYESSAMRIGINDRNSIISFFVKKK